MIVEAIKEGQEVKKNKLEGKEEEVEHKVLTLKTLFIQAIATAIDALSVGIIFSDTQPYIAYITFAIIGVITFAISIAAVYIGKAFGTIFSNKAALVGGIILVAIGIEIFFSNWSDVVGGLQAIFHFVTLIK